VWRWQELGQRLLVMSLVNETASEARIMKEFFQLEREDQLPTIKVIKAGTVDLAAGKMEVFETKVEPWEWNMEKAGQLARRTALKVLQKQPAFPVNSQFQITNQQEFSKRCITQTGRCAVYFVDIDKYKEQLGTMKEAMQGMESYFYKFHPMWADISLAHSVFNFKQVNPQHTPQLVILDVKEKVFAPQRIESVEKLKTVFRMFDQPKAMQRIKEGMKEGKSPLATEQTPTRFGAHSEL